MKTPEIPPHEMSFEELWNVYNSLQYTTIEEKKEGRKVEIKYINKEEMKKVKFGELTCHLDIREYIRFLNKEKTRIFPKYRQGKILVYDTVLSQEEFDDDIDKRRAIMLLRVLESMGTEFTFEGR